MHPVAKYEFTTLLLTCVISLMDILTGCTIVCLVEPARGIRAVWSTYDEDALGLTSASGYQHVLFWCFNHIRTDKKPMNNTGSHAHHGYFCESVSHPSFYPSEACKHDDRRLISTG